MDVANLQRKACALERQVQAPATIQNEQSCSRQAAASVMWCWQTPVQQQELENTEESQHRQPQPCHTCCTPRYCIMPTMHATIHVAYTPHAAFNASCPPCTPQYREVETQQSLAAHARERPTQGH